MPLPPSGLPIPIPVPGVGAGVGVGVGVVGGVVVAVGQKLINWPFCAHTPSGVKSFSEGFPLEWQAEQEVTSGEIGAVPQKAAT